MADWIARVEPAAYGPLQLRPEELWRTTPAELHALMDGWKWRDERERRLLAWIGANLINVHLPRGKRIKPDDLLVKRRPSDLLLSPEEKFRRLWEKVERQRKVAAGRGDGG